MRTSEYWTESSINSPPPAAPKLNLQAETNAQEPPEAWDLEARTIKQDLGTLLDGLNITIVF